ncbi:UPF0202 protein KRE33 [Durusdinium trenchii]|uniref:UPF0202 protein KRE33 n=2 Tax=Durusdinium trenchii TaxID=1381693 RepID=A0ABP0JT52_9DINO
MAADTGSASEAGTIVDSEEGKAGSTAWTTLEAKLPQGDAVRVESQNEHADKSIEAEELVSAIREVLEGKDLESFSLKDLRFDLCIPQKGLVRRGLRERITTHPPLQLEEGAPQALAMEQNLDLEAGALESRKAEISELAQAELNRETRRTRRRKRKAVGVDWQRAVRRVEVESAGTAKGPQEPAEEAGALVDMPPISAQIEGHSLQLTGKVFSSGTFGYHGCARLAVEIGGETRSLMCQVSCAVLKEG